MPPDAPLALCLATSGLHGEVGLALPDGELRVHALGQGAARGRGILPAVEGLLADAGREIADLTALAVDVGPGSFTGIRVGVTTAKSLAWALGLPVTGVLSLAALARAAPPDREVLAVRDAGRGRLYHARFGSEIDGRRARLAAPGRDPAAEVLSAARGSLVVGEEAPALLARSRADLPDGPGEALEVRAGAAAVLAEARAEPDEGRADSPHVLVPVYLQVSAPERRLAGEVDEGPAAPGRNDRPK